MTRQRILFLVIVGIILTTTIAYGQVYEGSLKQVTGRDSAPMILIPAGEFQMGSNDGAGDEKPAHTVYTDAFCIDVYEVTNAQYARFLNEYKAKIGLRGVLTDSDGNKLMNIDSKHIPVENVPINKVGDTYIPKTGYENHPVNFVSWYGAVAYAKHYGKRLPTEAEWERAARDGLMGKQYPWGDIPPDGAFCNFADRSTISGRNSEWSHRKAYDGHHYTAPVGSYMPNGYGLHDMAGNVWEWCADWYGYYPNSYEKNPTGPDSGAARILRGGSWNNTPKHLRVAYRYSRKPTITIPYVGFRCASDVTP